MEAFDVRGFAHAWVTHWNDHDLDSILNHYANDVVVRTPQAELWRADSQGVVRGSENLREYWGAALKSAPGLHFVLEDALVSTNAITLIYRNPPGTVGC